MKKSSNSLTGRLAICALVAVTAAAPVQAHHSFAMFDREKQITVKGTVKEFQWTNPHIFIQIMAPGAGGKLEEWSIEGGSPNMLFRQGWEPTTFKAGDQVTMVINPLKEGGRGGNFVFATLPNGKTVGNMNARAPG
ncbi:MAG: DUF6152 family protein [Caulobacteraceae bacterium]